VDSQVPKSKPSVLGKRKYNREKIMASIDSHNGNDHDEEDHEIDDDFAM
jgi:hypothetical protein